MATLSQTTAPYTTTSNWLTTYTTFADNAEFNRIGWAATAIALQGCILSPVLWLVMLTDWPPCGEAWAAPAALRLTAPPAAIATMAMATERFTLRI